MIYYSMPWATDKNIGKYYNQFMELLPSDNDYACFIDGDAMFTTTYYGKQLEEVIARYPECGLFTACASRIGCKWQRSGEWDTDDIRLHRQFGEVLRVAYGDSSELVTDKAQLEPMGGVLILIRKKEWKQVGGFCDGILGVDNDMHRKFATNNLEVRLMKGVYLYHFYRGGNQSERSHLL